MLSIANMGRGNDIHIHLHADTDAKMHRLNTHPSIWLALASALRRSHKEHIKSLNQRVHSICCLPLTCYLVCNVFTTVCGLHNECSVGMHLREKRANWIEKKYISSTRMELGSLKEIDSCF